MTSPVSTPPPPTQPPRNLRSALARAREELHHLRLWLRRTFTREQVISNLKTMMWVAPLTVLIWVYAEREQMAEEKDVLVPLSIRSEDPARVVTVQRADADDMVRVDLRGPRSQLQAVKAELSRPDARSIQITIDRNAALGQQELRLQLLVPNDPIFQERGIEVNNVRPSSISVYVDALVERDIDISLRESDQQYISTAVFTPRSVKVRGPAQVFQEAAGAGGVKVYADLSSFPQARQPGKQQELPTVPLELSVNNELMKLSQTAVEATLDVRQADIDGEIKSVPVWWGGPSNLVNDYAVEHDEFVKNVKVIGPADQIARLESETATPPPLAWLIISRDDLSAGETGQKPLRWEMPPGVRVKDENQPYSFRLVPKDGSAR